MFKFLAKLDDGSGNLYGFGLTEANLNRLQFNEEPIFFDFGYAGQPNLYGLIFYVDAFETPQDLRDHGQKVIEEMTLPFLVPGIVTPERIRVFPMTRSVMSQFREQPFSYAQNQTFITAETDIQLFFSGPDEVSIRKHFESTGLITPDTVEFNPPPIGRKKSQGFGDS